GLERGDLLLQRRGLAGQQTTHDEAVLHGQRQQDDAGKNEQDSRQRLVAGWPRREVERLHAAFLATAAAAPASAWATAGGPTLSLPHGSSSCGSRAKASRSRPAASANGSAPERTSTSCSPMPASRSR